MSGVEDPQRPPRLVLDDPASGDFSQTQRTPSILQAEEADDEIIDGGGDELVAGAALGDAGALAQQDDLVTERQRLVDVVGDEDDGRRG